MSFVVVVVSTWGPIEVKGPWMIATVLRDGKDSSQKSGGNPNPGASGNLRDVLATAR